MIIPTGATASERFLVSSKANKASTRKAIAPKKPLALVSTAI